MLSVSIRIQLENFLAISMAFNQHSYRQYKKKYRFHHFFRHGAAAMEHTYAGTYQSIWGIFRKLRFHFDIPKWLVLLIWSRTFFALAHLSTRCVPFTYQSFSSYFFLLSTLTPWSNISFLLKYFCLYSKPLSFLCDFYPLHRADSRCRFRSLIASFLSST